MIRDIRQKSGSPIVFYRVLALILALAWLSGCETMRLPDIQSLGVGRDDNVVAGLREALRVGFGRATKRAASEGGYNRDEAIRITTPSSIAGMVGVLRKVGLGERVDDFENRMNAAAEKAAVEAAPVFIDAIRRMTFADAKNILDGGDTAATEYFRGQTSDELRRRYSPIIERQMEQIGAVAAYNELLAQYQRVPLAPKIEFSMEEYVVDKSLDGLFHLLGEEERRIRREPAARTSELLRQVFGH